MGSRSSGLPSSGSDAKVSDLRRGASTQELTFDARLHWVLPGNWLRSCGEVQVRAAQISADSPRGRTIPCGDEPLLPRRQWLDPLQLLHLRCGDQPL